MLESENRETLSWLSVGKFSTTIGSCLLWATVRSAVLGVSLAGGVVISCPVGVVLLTSVEYDFSGSETTDSGTEGFPARVVFVWVGEDADLNWCPGIR